MNTSAKGHWPDAMHSLSDLAKTTRRYSISDRGQGVYEVIDDRRLLDGLLQLRAIVPIDESTKLSDWEEPRKQQSAGPNLNEADLEVLIWLAGKALAYDDDATAKYCDALCRAAVVFDGSEAAVRRFLLAKLWWHL